MADRGLTGVLLVGGASRRFGSPKALAAFEGETLADRAWRLLGEVCDERLALGKAADALPLAFPLLDDGVEVRHPAAGIVAALRIAAHEVCVVLPVDCPAMTADGLRALADACADAAVPAGGGPIPGAYRKTALSPLERCLADRSRLRDALARLDVCEVELDPLLFADADTVEELAAIEARGRG